MRKVISTALIAISTFLVIQSCSKSGDGGSKTPDKGSSFDRKAMLTNISNNVIIPAYNAFQTNVNSLDAAVTAFNTAPDNAKLLTLQTAFKAAYLQWQATSEFNFGPADQASLTANTNIFPATVSLINSNISSGTYDLGQLTNLPAKGLPALDYLLFGTGADNNAILAQYTSDVNAAKRKAYIAALSADLKKNVTAVTAAWNGAYKTTFVNADGTDAGSSVSLLINQMVIDYENLKNNEIGIPAGIQSMGTVLPEKVQAYYAKNSIQLALAHIQAVQNIYLGKDGLGLDDYLISADAKLTDGTPVNDLIKNQFATAITKLNGLKDPLSDQIKSNNAAVLATYTELQKLTVYLKTDMTSALGIAITFVDTDGD
jgi:predicted lipoprotein